MKRELQVMLKLIKAEQAPPTIIDDMWAAERRKGEIETALAEVPEQKVELHPSALTRYRYMVEELWSSIRRSEDAAPGREVSFRPGTGRFYEHEGPRKAAAQTVATREEGQQEARKRAREALRSLVDRIVIAPDGPATDKRGGGPVSVTVHGQLAALLTDDGRTESGDSVRRVVLVAGVGFDHHR